MAYRLTAQTNKGSYRPAYYHLNEHRDLGWSAKVVAGKFRLSPSGDNGDSGERWLYGVVTVDASGVLWLRTIDGERSVLSGGAASPVVHH